MSIMVKDVNGMEQSVASNGKANAGLTLGIIGTALSALGGGLGGVLNGVSGVDVAGDTCVVSQKQFYETELANRDREFANYQSLYHQICDLAQRVSVNETANAYQNMLNYKQFECVDKQMSWDRIATTYQIDAATCRKMDGVLSLPLSALSNGFRANDNYLATYSNYGGCGCGYGTFNGWGCGTF